MFRGTKMWLAGVAVVVGVSLCVAIPAALDNTGWLPHERTTAMYFGAAAWRPGAYRDCVALPTQDGSMLFLGCVAGAESYLTPEPTRVVFWGKIKRPDRYQAAMSDLSAWKWRCLRKKDSVACWAVN